MRDFKAGIIRVLRAADRGEAKFKIVEKRLGIQKRDFSEFNKAMRELQRDGKILSDGQRVRLIRSSAGAKKKKQKPAITGVVSRLAGTFGFVRLDNTNEEVFIPGKYLKGAMPGDKVEVHVNKGEDGRDDGRVTEIIETANTPILGTIVKEGRDYYLDADRGFKEPIYLGRELNTAKSGERVLASISKRGQSHSGHRIEIDEVLGDASLAASSVKGILKSNAILTEFPEEAINQAKIIYENGIHPKEIEGRLDLRHIPLFTIDSAYSKDMDDAVHLFKKETGYELGVHIADVSYYVTQGSPLDKEALERGTSLYYADKVIPMLPPELSNELCSLNPNVDRLALTAIIDLDHDGEIVKYSFHRTVIHSRIKGVYSEINEILEDTASEEIIAKYGELIPQIKLMYSLAKILEKKRFNNGGLALESVESRIGLDSEGRAVLVEPRKTGISEGIIEEFMLTANKAAAYFSNDNDLPFLYRIHEEPTAQKIDMLVEVVRSLGLSAEGIELGVSQKRLAKLLKDAKDKPYSLAVNDVLLKSMSKAKYSSESKGHYGLAFKDYAHFTSPIRRYPDLMIHRIISSHLLNMRRENIEKRYRNFVNVAADKSNAGELRAMKAERECEDCYKAEYMSQFIGEEFEGIVSGITSHGIYVQLPSTVEGLLGARYLNEYQFDGKLKYIHNENKKTITIGTAVRIEVVDTKIPLGQIDFSLIEVVY